MMMTEHPMKIGHRTIDSTGDFRNRYDYLSFYTRTLGQSLIPKTFPNYFALCPFHHDTKNPNLMINVVTGRAHCWACGKEAYPEDFIVRKKTDGTLVFNFPEDVMDPAELEKIQLYYRDELNRKEPDPLTLVMEEARAQSAHEYLFRQSYAMQTLQTKRGLTTETIKKFRIGFMRGVTVFPIMDIKGKIASLKFHKRYQTEFAKNQLFPWESVTGYKKDYCVIVEGEFDMLITYQNGINCVTQTAGANSWDPEFNRYFRNKIVYIAYDNDEAGKEGAIAAAKSLWKDRCDVNFVKWPSFMENKEDHVDFFVKYRQTTADYKQLLNSAKNIIYM